MSIFYTRWQHRVLYNNANHTCVHTHTHTHTHTHSVRGGDVNDRFTSRIKSGGGFRGGRGVATR